MLRSHEELAGAPQDLEGRHSQEARANLLQRQGVPAHTLDAREHSRKHVPVDPRTCVAQLGKRDREPFDHRIDRDASILEHVEDHPACFA